MYTYLPAYVKCLGKIFFWWSSGMEDTLPSPPKSTQSDRLVLRSGVSCRPSVASEESSPGLGSKNGVTHLRLHLQCIWSALGIPEWGVCICAFAGSKNGVSAFAVICGAFGAPEWGVYICGICVAGVGCLHLRQE